MIFHKKYIDQCFSLEMKLIEEIDQFRSKIAMLPEI